MSLITQCPVCGTTFKVVRDQLKISEGWVRCGQCAEVFDSGPNLREVDLDPQAAIAAPLPPQHDVVQDDISLAVTAIHAETDEQPPLPELPEVMASEPSLHNEPLLQADPPDFSFIAGPTVISRWDGRWMRFCMALLSVLLFLALLGQVIYRERDRLSAVDLRWRSALTTACEAVGCEVRSWRQIESIAVESSSFNKLRADAYRLSFVITNAADVQLAKPALELTLTDSQDAALMRRVLLPSELDAQVGTVSAHGEWTGSHVVSISAPSASLAKSVAGYRLLAFYP